MDTRVAETRKISKSAAVRVAGKLSILYSYYTVVAAFHSKTGTLYTTDADWSTTTKRHLNRFQRECGSSEVVELDQLELEERVYGYLAKRARRLRERTREVSVGPDEAAQDRLDDEVMEEPRNRAKPISIPYGVPVVFTRHPK